MIWKIPLSNIDFDKREIEAAEDVLLSGWLTMGEKTKEFETVFAEYVGVKHAFAVSNCTAALHIAHMVLGAGNGDEVICPSLTFVATANSIIYTGATPIFADISSVDDLNISPKSILEKISPRTKGITVVHYAGYPCAMDRIIEIAKEHKLYVVEDVAHAPGALYHGKKCGTIGDTSCFSFFSNKNMTTGEGGMIVTNRDDLAEKIKLIRSHGMTTLTLDRHRGHSYSYDVTALGYNYRTSELNSALGIVQLGKLERNNLKRRQIGLLYRKLLAPLAELLTMPFSHDEGSTYHIFPVLLSKQVNRGHFMKNMKQKGIQCSIHYPPVHLFSYYRSIYKNKINAIPVTEMVGEREVTLPLYPQLTVGDVEYVVSGVRDSLSDDIART